jgi:hypothetical protein
MPTSSIVITPPGELMWAKILKPAPLEKKVEGRPVKTGWSIELLLAEKDDATGRLVSEIQDFFWMKHGSGKRPGQNGKPYKQFLDEKDKPTGLLIFKFKTNQFMKEAGYGSGESAMRELPPPHVEDAQGRPWPREMLIGNGSVGRVAFTMYAWANVEGGLGVSLDLKAVRILEHVPYQGIDAANAFGDPEEGFALPNDSPFGQSVQQTQPADWSSDEEAPF